MRRLRPLIPSVLTGCLFVRGLAPHLPGWSCPLRALTGIPCPTCFLTRATAAALTGNLVQSVQLHAFGPPLAAGLVVWSILSLQQKRLLPIPPGRSRRDLLPVVIAGSSALIVYWAARLALRLLLGWPTFPLP